MIVFLVCLSILLGFAAAGLAFYCVKLRRQNKALKSLTRGAMRRSQLAATMAHPLRVRLDYQTISRQIMPIDQLPDGASPLYYQEPEEKG